MFSLVGLFLAKTVPRFQYAGQANERTSDKNKVTIQLLSTIICSILILKERITRVGLSKAARERSAETCGRPASYSTKSCKEGWF